MKNDGSAAEQAFLEYWTKRGAHIERLRDKKDLIGLNNGLKIADFSKPADYLVSANDVPLHYAEVKSTTHPLRFSFSNIRPAQSAAALLEASRGSQSYVFYIWSYANHKWYVMDCQLYAAALETGLRSMLFSGLKEWHK